MGWSWEAREQATEALHDLWFEYRETEDPGVRDRLILSLAPMVKQIVGKRTRRMPRHCDVDDFLSAGMEALIRALDRFEPTRSVSLEQFVWTRIHGAVLDEARRQDWAPRSLRAFQREREKIVRQFTAVHGRSPRISEVGDALAMAPAELASWDARAANADLHSLNVPVGAGEDDDENTELLDTLRSRDRATHPLDALLAHDVDVRVRSALDDLPSRDRAVAGLLYGEDRTMREVGEMLGVTESRVSQLNSRIKRRVEAALTPAA